MRLIALLLLIAAAGCARVPARATLENEYSEGTRDLKETVKAYTAPFPAE